MPIAKHHLFYLIQEQIFNKRGDFIALLTHAIS